jgi:hypothetical protein
VGGGGNVPFNGHVAEEFLDLRSTHILWVPLITEKDEALNPVDISLLGRVRIILEPNRLANVI